MHKKYILALDQGTTSCRAIIFNKQGLVIASAHQEFKQYYPHPGWVEHDATEIWQVQMAVARQAIQKALLKPEDILAIGVTNQRETVVFWDKYTGQPLAPAIVWQCRRSAEICDELRAQGHEATIRTKTGLVLDAYFSGTKIKWFFDRHPELRFRAIKGDVLVGNIDSWLVFNLSGGKLHCTEPSNASRTMLYNIYTGEWDSDLLELLNVPEAVLPEIRSSSEIYGLTTPALFDGTEIPIAGMAGDQQAALFGQGCFAPGMIKNTYGTGCFMLMNTGETPVVSSAGLLTSVAWQLDAHHRHYILEGSVFMAGAVIQWLRDELELISNAAESEALAASLTGNDGVYLVPAFVGLGAPYWDMQARGILTGLTRGAGKAHFCRAALEAIAYQVKDIVTAMEKDAQVPLQVLRVDGGATVNQFLMQFQADILQVPVERPMVTETTALGAAYLAGLAVGYWENQADISQNWQLGTRFTPDIKAEYAQQLYHGWQAAVQQTRFRTSPSTP